MPLLRLFSERLKTSSCSSMTTKSSTTVWNFDIGFVFQLCYVRFWYHSIHNIEGNKWLITSLLTKVCIYSDGSLDCLFFVFLLHYYSIKRLLHLLIALVFHKKTSLCYGAFWYCSSLTYYVCFDTKPCHTYFALANLCPTCKSSHISLLLIVSTLFLLVVSYFLVYLVALQHSCAHFLTDKNIRPASLWKPPRKKLPTPPFF